MLLQKAAVAEHIRNQPKKHAPASNSNETNSLNVFFLNLGYAGCFFSDTKQGWIHWDFDLNIIVIMFFSRTTVTCSYYFDGAVGCCCVMWTDTYVFPIPKFAKALPKTAAALHQEVPDVFRLPVGLWGKVWFTVWVHCVNCLFIRLFSVRKKNLISTCLGGDCRMCAMFFAWFL